MLLLREEGKEQDGVERGALEITLKSQLLWEERTLRGTRSSSICFCEAHPQVRP